MKKTMDLSERDYNDIAEKFQLEQTLITQQSFLENQYKDLLKKVINFGRNTIYSHYIITFHYP